MPVTSHSSPPSNSPPSPPQSPHASTPSNTSNTNSIPILADATVSASVQPRTLIASMLVIWLVYFLLATLRGMLVGFDFDPTLLARRALVCLAGVAITALFWLVLRLFEARTMWQKVAAALIFAMPASLMIAKINEWAFADIREALEQKIGAQQGLSVSRDEAGNLLVDLPAHRLEYVDEREGDREGEGIQNTQGNEEAGPANQIFAGTSPASPAPSPSAPHSSPPPHSSSASPEISQNATTPPNLRLTLASSTVEEWREIIEFALGRYFLLLAWASLYLALLAGARSRAAEAREGQFRRAAKEAELRSLRYQVNPHFLFNALNSLSALVMTGKAERAESMIQTLSNFYRHSLAETMTADTILREEIALQIHYLEIEAIRFPERLSWKIDMPEALEEALVPGMILQPLVENSVKYAVAQVNYAVQLRISARAEAGDLVLSVSDDGPGKKDGEDARAFDGLYPGENDEGNCSENAEHHGLGIGLANVRERLEARFGRRAWVKAGVRSEVRSGAGSGVRPAAGSGGQGDEKNHATPGEGGDVGNNGFETIIHMPLTFHDKGREE